MTHESYPAIIHKNEASLYIFKVVRTFKEFRDRFILVYNVTNVKEWLLSTLSIEFQT